MTVATLCVSPCTYRVSLDHKVSLEKQDRKERRECEEKKVTQAFQDHREWREIQGQKATRDHRGCRDQRYALAQ